MKILRRISEHSSLTLPKDKTPLRSISSSQSKYLKMGTDRIEFRDMSLPYTEQEIEDIIAASKNFKTYDASSDSFGTEDAAAVCRAARWDRSETQVQAFEDYFNTHAGGRLSLPGLSVLLRNMHQCSLYARCYATWADSNKDGRISQEEFEQVYALMAIQWPKVKGKTFAEFVTEADVDHNGWVDIEEFVAWLQKHE